MEGQCKGVALRQNERKNWGSPPPMQTVLSHFYHCKVTASLWGGIPLSHKVFSCLHHHWFPPVWQNTGMQLTLNEVCSEDGTHLFHVTYYIGDHSLLFFGWSPQTQPVQLSLKFMRCDSPWDFLPNQFTLLFNAFPCPSSIHHSLTNTLSFCFAVFYSAPLGKS